MKKETKETKNRTDQELRKLLGEKEEALRVFRFALAGSRTRNVKEGLALRKERARLATEMNGRSQGARR